MSTYSSDFGLDTCGIDVAHSYVEENIRLYVYGDADGYEATVYLSIETARKVAQSIIRQCDELQRNPY